MASTAVWIVGALVLAGWLIASAIKSAIHKLGESLRSEQAREQDGSEVVEKGEVWRSYQYSRHYGKVVLYPPNGEPLVYEFPAPQNPDEDSAALDWGVRRQPDGTLKILRWPDPGLPARKIETTSLCRVR